VNALLLAVVNQLGRWVVWVELHLVDSWDGLARRVLEENLEILDRKVGDTNVLDAAGSWELLELSPGIRISAVALVQPFRLLLTRCQQSSSLGSAS